MANGEENENLAESLQQLQESQLVVGQSAFDAINEHDRLMNQLRCMIAEAQELFGSMDMVNMEITAALEEAGLGRDQKNIFFEMNDKNAMLAEKLLCRLQDILSAAESGSETIHRMEEDIAQAQDAVDLVCEAVDKIQ